MQTGENSGFDVLVIGAGAAGLMAAYTLSAAGLKVAVAEALPRTGGRMYTVDHPGFEQPVELGAEFVHGDLPLTKELLDQAGIQTTVIEGTIWQHTPEGLHQEAGFLEDETDVEHPCKNLEHDIPVAAFLQSLPAEQVAALRGYVEGYYAADIERASARALCADMEKKEEDQYRLQGGYRRLAHYLEQQCRQQGVVFFMETPVWQLHWKPGKIEAITPSGSIHAAKVLVTVSIGVLQQEGITFFPALPRKREAAKALGFGHVVKINLEFREAFWKQEACTRGKDLNDLLFLFSEAAIPTWWSQHPTHNGQLTGWLGGPRAQAMGSYSKEELVSQALTSLSQIFDIPLDKLAAQLAAAELHNWSADAHFNGAYSYEVVNGQAYMHILLEPEADTVFFGGEGLHPGPEIGTVEAALVSGKEVAQKVLATT